MQKFDRGVSLLTWAYNEEASIHGFLDRAVALLDATVLNWEIVCIDDGSTDNTPALLAAYAAKEPRLRVLTNDRNRNVGYSAKRAISEARKELLLWQTVDWSYDLSDLRTLLELTNRFDVVVGTRPYIARLVTAIPVVRSLFRVKTRSDNLWRAVISLSNYYLLRILFGVPFSDFQNVHIYPTRTAQLFRLQADSSFLSPELLLRCHWMGCTFIETPIKFIPRAEGEAKGARVGFVVRCVLDIVKNWWQWGITMRRETRYFKRTGRKIGRIYRVVEPFSLDEETIRIAAPLFRHYRAPLADK